MTGSASSGDASLLAPFADGLASARPARAVALLTMEGKPLSCSAFTSRHCAGALAEFALHHHRVEPAAELEANVGVGSNHLKAAGRVDADGCGIRRIPDHRDHLPKAARLAFGNQPFEQLPADSTSVSSRPQIDRILHREAIGW